MTEEAQKTKPVRVMDLMEIDLKEFVSAETYVPKIVKITDANGEITERRVEIKKISKGEEDEVLSQFNRRQIETGADGQMSGFSMSLGEIDDMRKKLVAAALAKYNLGNEGVKDMSSELYSQIAKAVLEVNPIDMLQMPDRETDKAGKAGKAGKADLVKESTEEKIKND